MSQATDFNLLFVCRHNSVRSQLAAILTARISHGNVQARSAGPEPTIVPDFVQQWAQDMNGPCPALQCTDLDSLQNQRFDMIVTLCDKSHQALPELPSDQEHIRWDFHHANGWDDVRHLEMELAERIRLLLTVKRLI